MNDIVLSAVQRREKLRYIIICLKSALFNDEEECLLMEIASRVSPDPRWIDYVYKPSRYGLDGSIEAAIEKAFAYQPINLGPPAD